ncbi:glycosyltransferase family 2 protein [Streptococcus merionis]|uniref:Glycosyl transferase n=1 Tax=Streptococcus merionis TaxID=400065 RepID=A0A239SLY1_9STRE|nr:glycosyltransferase [Streptococcus merionis]SNU86440.1 glycosyl transferase [Streptococcus merionis]
MGLMLEFLKISQNIFLVYLLGYASFLLLSLVIAGVYLHEKSERRRQQSSSENAGEVGVSIIIPAYNEEVTIVDAVTSLLNLDYQSYEIIVVDDGSEDATARLVRENFELEEEDVTINLFIPCHPYHRISKRQFGHVTLTLIEKENGGKGDALNLGVNAAIHDYFLCIDADSMLQADSLKQITKPVRQDATTIAVGGLVQVSQGVRLSKGSVKDYKLPWQPLCCAQAIEYDCSFLGSRILLDYFKANAIISGAFGLFHKEMVQAVGGYDCGTLGEDMELVMKLHYFCRNNKIPYQICYETDAVCWSQAPSHLGDLCQQRRRWFFGLYQCLKKYHRMFLNPRFGALGFLTFPYYFLFEFLCPFLEVFGISLILLSFYFHQSNWSFLLSLFVLYIVYCSLLTMASFLQRVYAQRLFIRGNDVLKAIYTAFFRYMVLHWIISFMQVTSFIGYKHKKMRWGEIKRDKVEKVSP